MLSRMDFLVGCSALLHWKREEKKKNSFPYKKKKVFVPRTKTGKNTFLFVSSLDNEQGRKSGKRLFLVVNAGISKVHFFSEGQR